MTKKAAVLERDILAACLDYLRIRRICCWRNSVGAFKVGDRFMRVGRAGSADITGLLAPSGRRLEVEVKTSEGVQSPEQAAFQREIEESGGLYILARSVDDLAAQL